MKTCFKCNESKPMDDFYAHPQMADGRLNKCKECTKSDINAHRRNNLDRIREQDRERSRTPARKSWAKERQIRYRGSNPEKTAARNAVSNAVREGTLIRQPCEVCGKAESEAHHDDYSKPLDVRWLCRKHHLIEHGRYIIPGRDAQGTYRD